MQFFKSKAQRHQEKLREEEIFAEVAKEIASGNLSQGLWTKALSQSMGDRNAAESEYIKLRVDMMRSEVEAVSEVYEKAKNQLTKENAAAISSPPSQTNKKLTMGQKWGFFITIGVIPQLLLFPLIDHIQFSAISTAIAILCPLLFFGSMFIFVDKEEHS